MKLIVLLFCLVVQFIANAQLRIIEGTAVDISQRPFQAAIFINGEFTGGGVIISPEWILTAGHVPCLGGNTPVSPSVITVSTGYTNLNDDINRSSVQQVIIHPDYFTSSTSNGFVLVNDIALLKLSKPLVYGNNRQPVSISNKNVYSAQTNVVVSGWGRSGVNLPATLSQLYQANMKIYTCETQKIRLETSNSTAYKGDSGGPLTLSDNLIGLVSYGNGYEPQTSPSYYTNVGSYLGWIYEKTVSIQGSDIIHTQGDYSLSLTYNPNVTVSWKVSNSNKAQVSSSGRVSRVGTSSGIVTLTTNFTNILGAASVSRDILIGLPPFDISCLQQSVMENYRVGTTYNCFADPQWGDGILANNRLTYDWGYSKLSSTGQAGEWIRVNTYNNASFVDMQPAFRFTEPGTYRIEMYVRDGSVTSGMNSKTITVTGNYYSVYMNPACTQLTFTPQIQDMESEILPSLFSTLYSSTVKVHIYSDTSLKFSTILSATNDTNIDISSLDKGIYYLVILKDNAVIERHKILIRR